MILPTTSAPRHKHQSTRPQGLVLDTPYESSVATDQPCQEGGQTTDRVNATSIDVDELDGQLCEISISHDGDFATAVALVPSPCR
jgi:holo-[acyl-carrier protein] synthase